jgi:chorismate-pyruvate lyase
MSMSITQVESHNDLLNKILNASLGEVVTVLVENLNCKIYLDLIEQNTPKPGTEFERKITVSAEGLPVIRAVIKFDRKTLPAFIMNDLLQKRRKIGTILELNDIPNEKNIVFLAHDQKRLFRIYEIKNDGKVWFEISEEINLDYLYSIQREFSLPN